MEETLVLTVPNHHIPGCGKPPGIIAKDHYTTYFENEYGEQLVFTYDFGKKEGKLWHGDCGWDEPIEVSNGVAFDTVLGKEERAWLKLAWSVATKHPISTEFVQGSGNGDESYHDIKGFHDWGIKVPLRVPKEQVVRMLAALLSADMGLAGVDRTLRKWRSEIEESVEASIKDLGSEEDSQLDF